MFRFLFDRLLVCFTLAFIAGILLEANHLILVSALAVLGSFLGYFFTRHRRWVGGMLLALTALNGSLYYRGSTLPTSGTVATLPIGGQTLVGTITSTPSYSKGTWQFVLTVESHAVGDGFEPIQGTCLVRFHTLKKITRGQRWQFTGRFRRPSEVRNPGGKSEVIKVLPLGVDAILATQEPLALLLGKGDLGWLGRHVNTAQRNAYLSLERSVGNPYPEATAAIADSVIFGTHAAPAPEEMVEDFRAAGTLHLLVVSGSMVSLVFMMVFLPGALGAKWRRRQQQADVVSDDPHTGRGKIRRRPGLWAASLSILIIAYYAILTEGGQAVWRAAIMGVLVSIALVLRRIPAVARHHGLTVDRYTLLAVAALALLVLQPAALFTPGFQLTFVAVWSLLFLLPPLENLIPNKWANYIIQPVLGTLAAQLALFPILAWHFQRAPLAGLVSNIIAVPLASIVLIAGMVTCLLAPLAPWLALPTGWITGWATRGLIWTSATFASFSWSAPIIPRPAGCIIVLWYIGLILLGWVLYRKARTMALRTEREEVVTLF